MLKDISLVLAADYGSKSILEPVSEYFQDLAKCWLSIQIFNFLLIFCLETPKHGSDPTSFWTEPSLVDTVFTWTTIWGSVGTFRSQKCSPSKQFGKHCIRVMSTRISQSVYKCSVSSYTTTDPERKEHVALFHGPSITNEFCAVLWTLNALATRFIEMTKYTTEQRVAPFDCDRCAKTKRLGIIPK